MNPSSNPDSRPRLAWWCCAIAVVVGGGLAYWHVNDNDLLPIGRTSIEASNYDRLVLTNPFPARPAPTEPPGALRIWVYETFEMSEAPVAETVQRVGFELDSPWLKSLLKEKIASVDWRFAMKMRGQIYLSAPVTHMHLKSDNGYRLHFRDSQGKETLLENWTDGVTFDFPFVIEAEPGCYDIQIDYNNVQGGAFFNLWSDANDIAFFPADPELPKPAPAP